MSGRMEKVEGEGKGGMSGWEWGSEGKFEEGILKTSRRRSDSSCERMIVNFSVKCWSKLFGMQWEWKLEIHGEGPQASGLPETDSPSSVKRSTPDSCTLVLILTLLCVSAVHERSPGYCCIL